MFDKFSDEETKRLYYESVHPDSSGKTKVFNTEVPQKKRPKNLDKRLAHTESIQNNKSKNKKEQVLAQERFRRQLNAKKAQYSTQNKQQNNQQRADISTVISIIFVFMLLMMFLLGAV